MPSVISEDQIDSLVKAAQSGTPVNLVDDQQGTQTQAVQTQPPSPPSQDQLQQPPEVQQAIDKIVQGTGAKQPVPEKPSGWGDFVRGFDELAKTGGGIISLLGDLTGSDSTMQAGDEIFQKYKFQSELHPPAVGSFTNIGGVGDALLYTREAILGNAAMFIPGMVTGGIGSSVGEKLVGEMVENLAAKVGEEEAAKQVAKRIVIGRMFKSAEDLGTKTGVTAAGQEIGASAGAC